MKILSRSFYAEILALQGFPAGLRDSYFIRDKHGTARLSAQAVGGAVGHNPISLIIPCHRVVGASGSLIGYAGGVERKIQLLKLEGTDCIKLFVPKNVN